MTLVQASIANDGKCVILVADRLLTRSFGENFPSYEFEWNRPKIFSKAKVGIGFAGVALYADIAQDILFNEKKAKDFLQANQALVNPSEKINWNDIDIMVKLISTLIKNIRSGTIENTPASLRDNSLPIPTFRSLSRSEISYMDGIVNSHWNSNVSLQVSIKTAIQRSISLMKMAA